MFRSKCSPPIRLQDFLKFNISNHLKYNAHFLHVVGDSWFKLYNIFWVWSGMLSHAMFTELKRCQYLQKMLGCFICLLHVVTYPWKLQRYHVVLVG